jgi:hypothetical protein
MHKKYLVIDEPPENKEVLKKLVKNIKDIIAKKELPIKQEHINLLLNYKKKYKLDKKTEQYITTLLIKIDSINLDYKIEKYKAELDNKYIDKNKKVFTEHEFKRLRTQPLQLRLNAQPIKTGQPPPPVIDQVRNRQKAQTAPAKRPPLLTVQDIIRKKAQTAPAKRPPQKLPPAPPPTLVIDQVRNRQKAQTAPTPAPAIVEQVPNPIERPNGQLIRASV